MDIQLIIPMAGFGERFRRAGYTVPKPLIPVLGKPIIAHVLDMFPGVTHTFFICNEEHLAEPQFSLKKTIHTFCPEGTIIGIKPHKLGPVYTVSCAFEHFNPHLPTIVTYCDFACLWNWEAFKRSVNERPCDGAILCYTGFHPHMLRATQYAYVQHTGDTIVSIQEKLPYTDNPMSEYASSGAYYFSSGALLQDAFEKTMTRNDLQTNGEYFVSLAYIPMLEENKDIRLVEITSFMQWGTPNDLQEFLHHAHIHTLLLQQKKSVITHPGTLLVPMAGLGQRFCIEGYQTPKPFIPVEGEPMVIRAKNDLPQTQQTIFAVRADLPHLDTIKDTLYAIAPDCFIKVLPGVTDGQARTCVESLDNSLPDAPLTIGACDNGYVYDADIFQTIFTDPRVDFIVWTARGHPDAYHTPEMYGWVDADSQGWIRNVHVKKVFTNPMHDPVITGTFTFRRSNNFIRSAQRMFEREGAINNEYYIDECCNDALALGLKGRIFDVTAYLCWGTPDELRTYEYWRTVFSHWPATR